MQMLCGEEFINFVKSIYPNAKPVSGRRYITVRCKFCGDSKDPKHMHLYIKVPQDPSQLPFYRCFKCPAKGIADDEFFKLYGCNDPNLLAEYRNQVAAVKQNPKYATMAILRGAPLINRINLKPYNQIKLDYINQRIGSNFGLDDLGKLKIFLNLEDMIANNNLRPTMGSQDIATLEQYFFGFISYDNRRATMRKYIKENFTNWIGDLRYINYNFIYNNDDSKSFYVIPSQIDIANPLPTQIHIAEGVFDILSIFHNLNQCNAKQQIYIAASGKRYKQALQFVLSTIGVINYEVHYYIDNDVSDQEFSYLIKNTHLLPTKTYFHRNIFPNEKDYGVSLTRIKEKVTFQDEIRI